MKEKPLQYQVPVTLVPTMRTHGTNYPKSTQIRSGIDMMGVSGHRGHIPFEDRLKLIRKVPVMVALLCTGTRLTAGYRYTTLKDTTLKLGKLFADLTGAGLSLGLLLL